MILKTLKPVYIKEPCIRGESPFNVGPTPLITTIRSHQIKEVYYCCQLMRIKQQNRRMAAATTTTMSSCRIKTTIGVIGLLGVCIFI